MWGNVRSICLFFEKRSISLKDPSKSRLWLRTGCEGLQSAAFTQGKQSCKEREWLIPAIMATALVESMQELTLKEPEVPGWSFSTSHGSSHVDVGKDAKYIYQTLCQAGESFYTQSWYPPEQLLLCYCMLFFLKTRFVSSHESCCVSDQKSAMFSGAWRVFPSVPERFYKLAMFPHNSSQALLTRLTLRFLIFRSNNLCSSGCLVWRPLSWSFQRRQRYVSASGTWGVKRALTL